MLKCPAEVPPFLSSIIQAANQYIKHDPVCLCFRHVVHLADCIRTMLAETMMRMRRWPTKRMMRTKILTSELCFVQASECSR